jgi:hypothetical protein
MIYPDTKGRQHVKFKSLVFGAAAVAFCGLLAPVSAQQPAPAAPAQQVTQAHIDVAREVVVLTGISKTYDLFYPQLADSLVNTFSRTRPELRNDLIATVKALKPEFDKRDDEMVNTTARYFAGVMSLQALKDTAAFFKSDAGKQYVMMQPQVIDQMMAALDVWNRRMSEDLVTRVREEMRKKGHSL